MSYPVPLADAPPDAVRRFLENIAARREFRLGIGRAPGAGASRDWTGFGGAMSALPGLQLTGAQTFVRDFAGPDT